jgi:hypothetical protein
MKNKFVKLGIVAGVIIIGLFAYKKINATELHGSFTAGYNSELAFRGVSSGQDSIGTSFGTSLSLAGLDVGVEGLVNAKDGADEVRLGASTGLEILEGVSTSVGVLNYTDNHVLGNGTELYVELGAEIIFDAGARVYYNPDSEVTTFEGSLSHEVELWEGFGLGISAKAGSTELGGDRATYYGADLLLTRAINDETSLFLGVDLVDLKDIPNGDDTVSVFGGIKHVF